MKGAPHLSATEVRLFAYGMKCERNARGVNMQEFSPARWSVKNSSTVCENPHFSVIRKEAEDHKGGKHEYHIVHFPRPAVAVLPVAGTNVLLIRQYRFIVDEFVWAIPSGGVDAGESLDEAAIRELREETGYATASVMPWVNTYASYGCSDQKFVVFIATELDPNPQAFDETEVLETRWFTRAEVLDLVEGNKIVDGFSLAPILLFLLRTKADAMG